MMRIATILTALLLSACTATSPPTNDTEEIVATEGLFLSFQNQDGKVLKEITTGKETKFKVKPFRDNNVTYEALVVYTLNSCQEIGHLNYYKECTKPGQKVLLASGTITQHTSSDEQPPRSDDFRILKILDSEGNTETSTFKTHFQDKNLDVSWKFIDKQNQVTKEK